MLIAAVSIGLLGLLVYYGLALVELTAQDRYTALGVSVQYLYWSLVTGGVLWMVMLIASLVLDPDEPTPHTP